MLPWELLVLAALVTASLVLSLSLVLLVEVAARSFRSRSREGLGPLPGRVLEVLRDDYRGRHDREPSALRP